jgi:hypothetical protein
MAAAWLVGTSSRVVLLSGFWHIRSFRCDRLEAASINRSARTVNQKLVSLVVTLDCREELRLNPQLVHLVDDHGDVVRQDLTEHLVVLGLIETPSLHVNAEKQDDSSPTAHGTGTLLWERS